MEQGGFGSGSAVPTCDETKQVAQYAAAEGAKNILTGLQNAAGANAWNDRTVQEMVLGPELVQDCWKVEDLAKFDSYKLAAWVTR